MSAGRLRSGEVAGGVTKGAGFAEERGSGGGRSRRLGPQRVCRRLEGFSARDCEAGTLHQCLRNSNRLVRNLCPSLRALAVLCGRMCGGPGCVGRRRLSGLEGLVYLCFHFLAEN